MLNGCDALYLRGETKQFHSLATSTQQICWKTKIQLNESKRTPVPAVLK